MCEKTTHSTKVFDKNPKNKVKIFHFLFEIFGNLVVFLEKH